MISKDEISRYDRQIRLWGLEGQQNLSNAHVCVLGVGAISVELLKNIILAGVGSVTVVDSTHIEDEDLSWNYFVRADEIGMLRAPVTLRRAGALNPRVSVHHDERVLGEIPTAFFEEFSLVVANEVPYSELLRINEHTHERGIAFYATGLLGWGSFIFLDLVSHKYKAKKVMGGRPTEQGSVGPTRTILEVSQDGDDEQLLIEESYSSLRNAVATSGAFASKLRKKQLKKVSPYLPALLAHWESQSMSSADIETKAKAMGLPLSIFPENWTANFLSHASVQLAANASVVAGYLAQEVINYLTKKDHPIQNLLVYNAYEGDGQIYTL